MPYRRPNTRTRGRISARILSSSGPPATPTLTAPANNDTVFPGIAFTVSATSTDTNLDKMEWLFDGVVVATVVGAGTPAGTFSTTCTLTVPTTVAIANLNVAKGFIARATRSGQSTDSASINVTASSSFNLAAVSLGETVLGSWQSDLGVTLNVSAVSALADQSAGANALSQGTGANQPAYTASDATLNNMPSITFDGTNDSLGSTTLDLPAPNVSLHSVFQTVTWAIKIFWGAGGGNQYCVLGNTGTPKLAMLCSTQSPDNAGAVVGTWTRSMQRFTNSASDSFQLGSTTVTGSCGTVNPTVNYFWGRNALSSGFANIKMAAQTITSGTMSAPNQAKLDAMVTAIYGAGVAV